MIITEDHQRTVELTPEQTLDRWAGWREDGEDREGYRPFPVTAMGIRYLHVGSELPGVHRQHISVLVTLDGHAPARFCSSLDPGIPERDMIPNGDCPDCDRATIEMEPLDYAPEWLHQLVREHQPRAGWWRRKYWAAA